MVQRTDQDPLVVGPQARGGGAGEREPGQFGVPETVFHLPLDNGRPLPR